MREVTIRELAHKGDSKGEMKYVLDVVYWDISVVIPSAQQEAKPVESVAGKIILKKFARQSYARQVGREPDDNDPGPQHDYAFSITEGEHSEMVTVRVGGIDLKMLIDSGANSNIIDEGTWKQLKEKGVKCESQAATPDKKLCTHMRLVNHCQLRVVLSVQWVFVIDPPKLRSW